MFKTMLKSNLQNQSKNNLQKVSIYLSIYIYILPLLTNAIIKKGMDKNNLKKQNKNSSTLM